MKVKLNKLVLSMFALYIILKPLYVFQSLPFQPADLLLVFNFFGLLLVERRLNNIEKIHHVENTLSIYLLIIIYQVIINLNTFIIVSGSTPETFSLLKNNLYYFFNLFTMIYVYRLYKHFREDVFYAFSTGAFFSTIVVFIGLVVSFGKTTRNMSFFDNPNQLGYYSLIMLTGVFLLNRYFGVYKKIIIILMSITGIIVSLSKAAIIGCAILMVIMYFGWVLEEMKTGIHRKVLMRRIFPLALIVLMTILFYKKIIVVMTPYINSFYSRFEATTFSTAALGDSRGYSRISEIGANIIQGVGEGAFYRFSVMTGNETHSSFATIIVSYGIIGAFLYIVLFWNTICNKTRNIAPFFAFFSGMLFYWVSHNGLRNSILWILIVFFTILYSKKQGEERSDGVNTTK